MTSVRFTTSGSTGVPKSFSLTEEQLVARAEMRASVKGAEFGALQSLFCDQHPASVAFHSYHLWATTHDIRFFTPVGGTIQAAIALFAAEAIEGIVAGSSALYNYARANGEHRFACVLGSGMATPPERSKRIRAGLGETTFYSYGASEVGAIALATAAQVEAIPGCAGTPCDGVTVETVDGRVRIKSPVMATEYDDPRLTAQFFQDGWFYPGDVGHFTDDGLLVLERRFAGSF